MKLIKTEEAVGHVLCHDITEIVKDVRKGARFRKGHIVTEEDIPVLVKNLCYGDGRPGSISGFVTLNEEDCEKIYQLMV